ncbi:MAG: DUF2252 domain-containing protein [Streptosporangiales bacterium]|nr:DUF2252 domain-containing protein [Streptosporangiales bacterium]
MGDGERTDEIVDCLEDAFGTLMERDPRAFRHRFRRMAGDPFSFYRGAACLFYQDVVGLADPWVDEQTARVWIHGDLHAENFGTYLDGRGVLVFDVNDFDEAYLGHFTWDLMRCAASIALLGWSKAFPDETIREHIGRYVHGYLDQVAYYVAAEDDRAWALRLDSATGPVLHTLHAARHASRIGLLERESVVMDFEREFRHSAHVRELDDAERARVLAAYDKYLETIPVDKRLDSEVAYQVKDVVGRSGVGIGSAGLATYSVLIEGRSQAFENDVILSMKEGNVAAPSRVVRDERLADAFQHHGHRTALSQRALQAYADPFLGWTDIDGTGLVVRELSPYEQDLAWHELTEPAEIGQLVEDLGRASAKMHCVSDADAEAIVVEAQVEDLVHARLADSAAEFTAWVTDFALPYADRTRDDHRRFVDAFRAGAFHAVAAT